MEGRSSVTVIVLEAFKLLERKERQGSPPLRSVPGALGPRRKTPAVCSTCSFILKSASSKFTFKPVSSLRVLCPACLGSCQLTRPVRERGGRAGAPAFAAFGCLTADRGPSRWRTEAMERRCSPQVWILRCQRVCSLLGRLFFPGPLSARSSELQLMRPLPKTGSACLGADVRTHRCALVFKYLPSCVCYI